MNRALALLRVVTCERNRDQAKKKLEINPRIP